ncbi:Ig-like domain repeat protein [Haloimpatiens massiliensis]|uniref:Ig-like domain repeat protein n=1 Tax=Haloimpatiens massiliensis TaxID=1658110 RepID=UPI000C832737|nr:Ig-like domain repeat protein [Haloimpatiens massiliensis]
MNRKKLKAIIALTLSLCYSNVTFAKPVKAFSNVIYKAHSPRDMYENFIKDKLNLQTIDFTAAENSSTNLDAASALMQNNKENIKLFLGENEKGIFVSPTINSDKQEFSIPTKSFFKEKSLVIAPAENIETLNLFLSTGQSVNYSNLNKNSFYKLLNLDSNTQLNYALIKYKNDTNIYKQVFSFIKDEKEPSITDIKKEYRVENSKPIVRISWKESDTNLFDEISYKKVYFNNDLLDVTKSNLKNSYYCDIPIQNLPSKNIFHILTCDSTYQTGDMQGEFLALPHMDYSDKTLIKDDIIDGKYTIKFPFNSNVKNVAVKCNEDNFTLDSNNTTANILIPEAGTYEVTFKVTLISNESYTFTKNYIYDDKPLTLDNTTYKSKIYKTFDHTVDTDSIINKKIKNGDTIYYDGTTIDKGKNVFPINVSGNKDLKDLSITVNDQSVLDKSTNFTQDLALNAGSNLIFITARDKSGYTAKLYFTVEVATENYNFNIDADRGSVNKLDESNYEINSNKKLNLKAKLTDYPEDLVKENLYIEALDNNKKALQLDYSIDQNELIINDVSSNCSSISIKYLDKFNRVINSNISINIDVVNPIINSEISSTEFLNLSGLDKLKIDVWDDSLFIPRRINLTSDFSSNVKNSFCYEILDKNSNAVALTLPRDAVKINILSRKLSIDFSSSVKALNLPDGEYTLKCKYIDNVYNSSDEYLRKIVVDNTTPVIKSDFSTTLFKDSISIKKDGSSLLFNDKKVISVEDNNFHSLDYRIYKMDDNSKLEISDSTLNTSGDYVISVYCRDKAGNECTLNEAKFSLDCDAPSIDASENDSNAFNHRYYYKNGVFTLKFDDNYMDFSKSIYSSIDTDKTNSIYVSLTDTENPHINLFDSDKSIEADPKQLKFNIDELNLKDDEYKLCVKVIDKVGHITIKDYTLVVDKTQPKITTNEQDFKDKASIGNLNYYLFDKAVTINTTTSKPLNPNKKNTYNISIDEKNFKKGNITICKLKPNSESEEVENINLDAISVNSYSKTLTEGMYTINYHFEDLVGNKTEQSITLAVVSTPKINFGYLDKDGTFIYLKDVKYTKNDFSPVIKVEGLLNGNLKKCNITRTHLDDSNNIQTEEFNESDFTVTNHVNEYGECYYKLGSNVDNAFKFITLDDGEINYNFTFSSFFGEDVILHNKIFLEKNLPAVSATLNDLPTENQVNYINTTPEFKINVSKNYSSLKENTPSFIMKKLNADNSEIDVSDKFEIIKSNSTDYCSEFEIKLKPGTMFNENGVYMVSYKVNTNAQNSINKSFNFSYDTNSPSYSIKAVNNGTETNFNMDSVGNCFNKDSNTSLKIEFNDNSFKFNQSLADVSKLTNSIIVKKSDSNKTIFESGNFNSNSRIINSNIFTEGCYQIIIKSTDAANNIFTKNIKYYLDHTKPSIEFKNSPILTKETTHYFKDNFKPNFVITDATPLDTITINYSVNGIHYSSSADKFNENLLDTLNSLKKNISNKNQCKFHLIINGTDKAGNTIFENNEEFKCKLVLDSTAPKTTVSVNGTDITSNKHKIFDAIPNNIKLIVNDSNLNIDDIKNDFKVRYLETISNDPQKDVLSSPAMDIKFHYDDIMKGYVADIPYSGNGYYYIETSAKDYSENAEGLVRTFFTIDTTNVNVNLESNDGSFNLNKKYYNNSMNFSLNVAGHYSGFEKCQYSLIRDGVDVTKDFLTASFSGVNKGGYISFSLPKNKTLEGNYTFKYSIIGKVGGKKENVVNFIVDKTAPSLSHFNLNMGDGKVVNNIFYTNAPSANIKFNAYDKYTEVGDLIKTVSINGSNYKLSDTSVPNNYISADGKYTVSFSLTDNAGNTSSYSYSIVIDRVSPKLKVDGFNGTTSPEDQEFYINRNITPQISVTDTNGEDVSARNITLDNSTYSSSTISSNGKHTYKVRVKDYAGNFSEFEKTFILDTVFPVISTSDVINNKYYNKNVLPKFTVDDPNAKLYAYLNGSSYNGAYIKNDGIYELVIKATDRALNTTEIKIPFTIDKIAPIISIKGVLENQVNGGSVTPLITANEAQALITSLLNGEEYLGFTITDSGKYTLIVRAIDLAGNAAQKVISFIVDSTLPQITVKGLENGKVYTGPITPKIFASKNAKLKIFLNGKPYDGSKISEVGEYELKIIATDKVSNTSEAIYKFSITNDAAQVSSSSVGKTSTKANLKNKSKNNKANNNFFSKNVLPITATAIVGVIIAILASINIKKKKKENKKPEQ